jgi:hypothetical protein
MAVARPAGGPLILVIQGKRKKKKIRLRCSQSLIKNVRADIVALLSRLSIRAGIKTCDALWKSPEIYYKHKYSIIGKRKAREKAVEPAQKGQNKKKNGKRKKKKKKKTMTPWTRDFTTRRHRLKNHPNAMYLVPKWPPFPPESKNTHILPHPRVPRPARARRVVQRTHKNNIQLMTLNIQNI